MKNTYVYAKKEEEWRERKKERKKKRKIKVRKWLEKKPTISND